MPDSASPVAIGGVGGSGTRLVAGIVRELGRHMGDDLNSALDNLWFTLLFRRREAFDGREAEAEFQRGLRIFCQRMIRGTPPSGADARWVRSLTAGRPIDEKWLEQRAESLCRPGERRTSVTQWGWKEPNTHVFLDRLRAALPEMTYVHVMRNGLDMAYSSNQNQLRLWGPSFFGDGGFEISPRWSLKYWCAVHQRVLEYGRQMPGRLLLLNYDSFCTSPREGIDRLLDFLATPADEATRASLAELVQPPESIGRHRRHGVAVFDPEDVNYVESLGFDVGTAAV